MIRSGLFAVLLLLPSALWAHAYLMKSVPAKRAVLSHSPARIQLWFNERLEPRYSFLTLTDADGKPVQTGKSEVTSGKSQANFSPDQSANAGPVRNWIPGSFR